jgi:demethylspheroidene O-methyltransferase
VVTAGPGAAEVATNMAGPPGPETAAAAGRDAPRAPSARPAPPPAHLPWLQRLGERWRDWRHRTVARPDFQRWAAAFPLTRPVARRHARELFDLVAGFVYSQVLLACVRLDLFERLAAGPVSEAALAAQLNLGDEALGRLLAAAEALELVERRVGARVALGRLGAPLVGNRAVTAMVEHHATLYADLADPLALLQRQGRPRMAGYWPYVGYAQHGNAPVADVPEPAPAALSPERVAEYSALMSASQPLVTDEVLAAYDFRAHRHLLDVGGGEGSFVAAVARRAPGLRFTLFDLPAVAERAQARFALHGLGARAQASGGDFFRDPLPAGADIVTLIRVAFDHPDERVLALLRNVRRALPPGGTVLLAEPMSGVPGAEAMGDAYFGMYLLAMGRGRPRSAAALTALLQAAGFATVRQLPTRMPLQAGVLVAR